MTEDDKRRAREQHRLGLDLGVDLIQVTGDRGEDEDLDVQALLLAAEMNARFWISVAQESGLPPAAVGRVRALADNAARRVLALDSRSVH